MSSAQDLFKSPEHFAGTEGLGDASVGDLDADGEMAFDTSQGVNNHASTHEAIPSSACGNILERQSLGWLAWHAQHR